MEKDVVGEIRRFLAENGPQTFPVFYWNDDGTEFRDIFESILEEDSNITIDFSNKILFLDDIESKVFGKISHNAVQNKYNSLSAIVTKLLASGKSKTYPFLRGKDKSQVENILVEYVRRKHTMCVWGDRVFFEAGQKAPRSNDYKLIVAIKRFLERDYKSFIEWTDTSIEEVQEHLQSQRKLDHRLIGTSEIASKYLRGLIRRNPLFFGFDRKTVSYKEWAFEYELCCQDCGSDNKQTAAVKAASKELAMQFLVSVLRKEGCCSYENFLSKLKSASVQIAREFQTAAAIKQFITSNCQSQIEAGVTSASLIPNEQWDDLCKELVGKVRSSVKMPAGDTMSDIGPAECAELGSEEGFVEYRKRKKTPCNMKPLESGLIQRSEVSPSRGQLVQNNNKTTKSQKKKRSSRRQSKSKPGSSQTNNNSKLIVLTPTVLQSEPVTAFPPINVKSGRTNPSHFAAFHARDGEIIKNRATDSTGKLGNSMITRASRNKTEHAKQIHNVPNGVTIPSQPMTEPSDHIASGKISTNTGHRLRTGQRTYVNRHVAQTTTLPVTGSNVPTSTAIKQTDSLTNTSPAVRMCGKVWKSVDSWKLTSFQYGAVKSDSADKPQIPVRTFPSSNIAFRMPISNHDENLMQSGVSNRPHLPYDSTGRENTLIANSENSDSHPNVSNLSTNGSNDRAPNNEVINHRSTRSPPIEFAQTTPILDTDLHQIYLPSTSYPNPGKPIERTPLVVGPPASTERNDVPKPNEFRVAVLVNCFHGKTKVHVNILFLRSQKRQKLFGSVHDLQSFLSKTARFHVNDCWVTIQ